MTTMVQVNLLPPEVTQRARQRRLLLLVGALLAVYVLLLGALYAVKLGQVSRARAERDAAQAETVALQSELAILQPYRVLEQDLDQRDAILAQAMADEVSAARLLNELALAFPAASSLRSVTFTLDPPLPADPSAATVAPEAGAGTQPTADTAVPPPVTPPSTDGAATLPATGRIGLAAFEGYTVEDYAPGVRDVVVDLRTVPTFINPRILSAQDEDLGGTTVTSFAGDAVIDASAYTRRYVDGLDVEGPR